MSWLDRLLGNDHERAAQRPDRESATASAARQRRRSHRNAGALRAARQGQAWEDADRAQDRRGGWYRSRR